LRARSTAPVDRVPTVPVHAARAAQPRRASTWPAAALATLPRCLAHGRPPERKRALASTPARTVGAVSAEADQVQPLRRRTSSSRPSRFGHAERDGLDPVAQLGVWVGGLGRSLSPTRSRCRAVSEGSTLVPHVDRRTSQVSGRLPSEVQRFRAHGSRRLAGGTVTLCTFSASESEGKTVSGTTPPTPWTTRPPPLFPCYQGGGGQRPNSASYGRV
jgi:hypothetical protein